MRHWWMFGLLCMPWLAFSQPKGFRSVELQQVAYEEFSITAGYYPIACNINNRQSSAFISDSPSADEYVYFAQHQPSYYFLLHRQHELIRIIVLQQQSRNGHSTFFYTVIDPASGDRTRIGSQLAGDITQWRADELNVGPGNDDKVHRILSAATESHRFSFQQKHYRVQPYQAVWQEVKDLARDLVRSDRRQAEELEEYIRAETIGGTLDFKIALAKEPQQRFSRDGVAYNPHHFSVLLWGGAVRTLGMPSVLSARTLWEDIQQRPLTPPEYRALYKGFTEEDTMLTGREEQE